MKKHIIFFIFIFIFSFFTIKPLFTSGFFPMHDDTQVQRVYEMWVSLKDGMFPVRWVPDLGYGYGYPIFNFYGPLAYYIGGVFVFLTGNALIATKIMFGIGILLSGVTMYLFVQSLAGRYAGSIASLLYMYAPYHGLNIYVRGDVAEFFAYAFVPLIFYGIVSYMRTGSHRSILWGSIGYAGVILSHNLSAMMITPFIGIVLCYYIWTKRKEWKQYIWILSLPLLGIMVAAFYWLPTLGEMKYTNVLSQIGGGSDFRDHFVCLSQLWSTPWGYGGSIPGCIDGLSLQIGKIHVLFFILGTGILLWKKRFDGLVFTVLGIVSIFLLLPLSQFIWEIVPPMAFFQFPWRFLLPVTFFFSTVGGVGMGVLLNQYIKSEKLLWIITSCISLGIMFYGMKFFVPQTIINKTVNDYTEKQFLLWNTSKISDEYMPQNFNKPTSADGVVKQKVATTLASDIVVEHEKVGYQRYLIKTRSADTVKFFTAYFPSWNIYELDGQKRYALPYTIVRNGMEIDLPRTGEHTIELVFMQTPLEKIANGISLIGLLILGIGIIRPNAHEKNG